MQNVAIEMLAREGTSNKAIRDSIEYKLDNLEKELENLILNFEGQSEKLEQFIERNSQELVEMRIAVQDRSKVIIKSENENEDRWDFENQIQDLRTEITMLQADKTGMADFALEATGAQILPDLSSPGRDTKSAMISIWKWPLFYQTMSPRLAIQPQVHPGNCFAFSGSAGNLAVKLSRPITIQNVTIEHIPQSLAPTGDLKSAPKEIEIYSIRRDGSDRKLLDSISFEPKVDHIKTFQLNNAASGEAVLFKFLTNWGEEDYTCVYRVRVHGIPLN